MEYWDGISKKYSTPTERSDWSVLRACVININIHRYGDHTLPTHRQLSEVSCMYVVQVCGGGNDTVKVLAELEEGAREDPQAVLSVLSRVHGPWAFVYWQVSLEGVV